MIALHFFAMRRGDSQQNILLLPSPETFRFSGFGGRPFRVRAFERRPENGLPALLMTSAPLSTVQFSCFTIQDINFLSI